MACTETQPYTSEICDVVEPDFARLNPKQHLIDAANKYLAASPPSRHPHHSGPSAVGRPILCAWRWLVRDADKETVYYISLSPGRKKARELEGPTDLAYRGVMPAALGRAVQQTDVENEENVSDVEEYATIYDNPSCT